MHPGMVVSLAQQLGLRGIAITDHDTVSGVAVAKAMGVLLDFPVIPGVELSTDWCETEIHILGYWVPDDGEFVELLAELRNSRLKRMAKMVEKVSSMGYRVTMEEVQQEAGEGFPGRPHLARVLVKTRQFQTMREAFQTLLEKGKPGYVPREKLTPVEAIKLLQRFGAVPVLAHPGLIGRDGIIAELVAAGLRGLEVYHPEHSWWEIRKYRLIANRYGLVVTGGSDYHGPGLRANLGSHGIDGDGMGKLSELKGGSPQWKNRLV